MCVCMCSEQARTCARLCSEQACMCARLWVAKPLLGGKVEVLKTSIFYVVDGCKS
jgi:hypothetical protein